MFGCGMSTLQKRRHCRFEGMRTAFNLYAWLQAATSWPAQVMIGRLWDLSKTGKDRFAGKMEHADKVTAVVWIRTEEKGEQIVSASGKLVIVWDPRQN